MIIQITGDTGGLEPYDIFLCDSGNTSCFYVSGLTTIPNTVVIDTDIYFPNQVLLYLRIVDTNGCVVNYLINCSEQKMYQDLILFDFMDGNHYIFQ
jgi:hypothetical protein